MAHYHSFKHGVEIDDETINRWLDELRQKLIRDYETSFIASGDSVVQSFVFYDYITPDEARFHVATKDGYMSITIPWSELPKHDFTFRRDFL